jgi:DNA invertase Pin-like site-specific DNA recombinase
MRSARLRIPEDIKNWRTRLQPIRTAAEITAHIKILPVHQPYLYQKLSQKATQLRLLGMSYQQIAKSLNINKRTVMKACKYKAKNHCFGRQNPSTD